VAAFDSTAIAGIATAASTIAAAVLLRSGRKSGNRQEDDEDQPGVSLTKQVVNQQRKDFMRRIDELEAEIEDLRKSRDEARAERDTLQHELNYAQIRNKELNGP
jgi:peptidoglycan hydrolase CwlO-like protein